MISYLKGTVISKTNGGLVLEVGAVGVEILMPLTALADVGGVGAQARVETYLHLRENELALYGFSSPEQRELFLKLIEVSGVGPKVALSALSALSTEELITALISEDIALISSVPGIGKKTASRIVLDLKDKYASLGASAGASDATAHGSSSALVDARLALESMGFSPQEVASALKESDPASSTEQFIEFALKRLAR